MTTASFHSGAQAGHPTDSKGTPSKGLYQSVAMCLLQGSTQKPINNNHYIATDHQGA